MLGNISLSLQIAMLKLVFSTFFIIHFLKISHNLVIYSLFYGHIPHLKLNIELFAFNH